VYQVGRPSSKGIKCEYNDDPVPKGQQNPALHEQRSRTPGVDVNETSIVRAKSKPSKDLGGLDYIDYNSVVFNFFTHYLFLSLFFYSFLFRLCFFLHLLLSFRPFSISFLSSLLEGACGLIENLGFSKRKRKKEKYVSLSFE
jgi:hypothetical protein